MDYYRRQQHSRDDNCVSGPNMFYVTTSYKNVMFIPSLHINCNWSKQFFLVNISSLFISCSIYDAAKQKSGSIEPASAGNNLKIGQLLSFSMYLQSNFYRIKIVHILFLCFIKGTVEKCITAYKGLSQKYKYTSRHVSTIIKHSVLNRKRTWYNV